MNIRHSIPLVITAAIGLFVTACQHRPRTEPTPPPNHVFKSETGTFQFHVMRSQNHLDKSRITAGRDFAVPQGMPVKFEFSGTGVPVRVTIRRFKRAEPIFFEKIIAPSSTPESTTITFPFTGMVSIDVDPVASGEANLTVRYTDYHD